MNAGKTTERKYKSHSYVKSFLKNKIFVIFYVGWFNIYKGYTMAYNA